MLTWLRNRVVQGMPTLTYPNGPIEMPSTFAGRPVIEGDAEACPPDCEECIDVCPTDAVAIRPALTLDLGRCVFCSECVSSCPAGLFRMSRDFRMAATERQSLVVSSSEIPQVKELDRAMRRIFGRSMRIRFVSAGDCGGCKDEFNALSNTVFDLSRFGIGVVASPRHADALIVSGALPENMRVALEKAWLAMPQPKLVIALGACSISGGPFAGSPVCHSGLESILPVDLFIPGCPPHPLTVLDGLLRLLGRMPADRLPEKSSSLEPNAGEPMIGMRPEERR